MSLLIPNSEQPLNNIRSLLPFITLSGVALAQPTSSLTGMVTNPSGAVVPGVEVTLTIKQTNQQRVVTTDTQGRYSFPQMQPSTYDLSAHAPGFSDVTFP